MVGQETEKAFKKQPGVIPTQGPVPIDLYRPFQLKLPQVLRIVPPADDSMSKYTSLQRCLNCKRILVIFITFLCLYLRKGSISDFHWVYWRVYLLSSGPKDDRKSLVFIYFTFNISLEYSYS